MTQQELLDEAYQIQTETQSGANTANRVGNVLKDMILNIRPYKVYTALLTQSGEDAPTQIVIENTLGYHINWTYVTDGYYDTVETFSQEKTFVSITNNSFNIATKIFGAGIFSTEGPITIYTDDDNNSLNNTPIEIRVYE